MFAVHIAGKPRKFVESLQQDYKARIREKLEELQENPFPRKSIPLFGKPHCYRIRAGPFRIQYHVLEAEKAILVYKISRRDETTYG